MKLFIILGAAFLASACQKENSNQSIQAFNGNWELISYTGFGIPYNLLPEGNGNEIVLGEDGKFQRFENGTQVFDGNYNIKRKKICNYTGFFIKTNEAASDPESIISLESDTLHITSSPCLEDGGGGIYRRK